MSFPKLAVTFFNEDDQPAGLMLRELNNSFESCLTECIRLMDGKPMIVVDEYSQWCDQLPPASVCIDDLNSDLVDGLVSYHAPTLTFDGETVQWSALMQNGTHKGGEVKTRKYSLISIIESESNFISITEPDPSTDGEVTQKLVEPVKPVNLIPSPSPCPSRKGVTLKDILMRAGAAA